MFKYFTVQTANEVLPLVIQKYDNIKKQKNEIIKAEQELQVTLSDNGTFEKYVVKKQYINNEKKQTTFKGRVSVQLFEFQLIIINNLKNIPLKK